MKLICFLIIACLLTDQLTAQAGKTKTLKAGQQLDEVFSVDEVYRYAEFANGQVSFKDGTYANARLNYQRLFGEMVYIDQKGDTLAIATPEIINFITIGPDTFYKAPNGYVELIANYNSIKLGEKRGYQQVETQKIGAYGQAVTSSAITTYRDYYSAIGKLTLNANENIVFAQKSEYYLSDKYNHFVLATKKNIEKQFANNHKDFKAFLENNPTNFNKKEDLVKLIAYMQNR